MINDDPTILDPKDIYTMLETNPEICIHFGFYCKKDADDFIKSFFKRETWPEELREEDL